MSWRLRERSPCHLYVWRPSILLYRNGEAYATFWKRLLGILPSHNSLKQERFGRTGTGKASSLAGNTCVPDFPDRRMPQLAVCCRQVADILVQTTHAGHHMGFWIHVGLPGSNCGSCGLTPIARSIAHDTFPHSCFKMTRTHQR